MGFAATADRATAQAFTQNQPNPYLRQPVSPYLNMTRTGVPGGVNYYGLVKPQFDVNKQLQTLQMQQHNLMPQLGVGTEDDGTLSPYATTGHPTVFSNYGHYFGQAGGAIRPAQPPAPVLRKQ